MKRTFIISVLAMFVLSLSPTSATAVLNGAPALGDERVVLITESLRGKLGCTGSLVSPRVVFTAGHCVTTATYVFPPNAVVGTPSSPSPTRILKKFMPKEFNTCENCGRGPIQDFGVLVLEKELADVTPMRIANLQEIQKLIDSQVDVVQVGYGVKQLAPNHTGASVDTNYPERLVSKLRTTTFLQNNDEEKALIQSKPNIFINTVNSPEKTMCGGDSGSPLYFLDDAKYVYVGALSAVTGVACHHAKDDPMRTNPYWLERTYGVYYVAAYYQSTIDEAFAFANSQPAAPVSVQVVEPKPKTITCIKGKQTKRVSGVAPKCPKGFKKK